jgi:hypothetical protein
MRIVIEIPNKDIPKRQEVIDIPLHFMNGRVCEAGGYGFMELPKGCGDLIDRSETIKSLFDYHNGKKTIGQCIDDVQTIIEEDKTESEGV